MARRVVRLAVCFVSAALALAWSQSNPQTSPASPSAAAPPKTALLEGKVISQTTGTPLKKTMLTLSPSNIGGAGRPLTTESDEEGRFFFPKVEPGIYSLRGERAGYASQSYNAHSGSGYGAPIPLKEGDEVKDILFKLVPNALLSGRVLDEDGDPVARAAVVVMHPAYRTSGRQLQSFTNATTGANGEFSMSVPPGRYYLATMQMNGLIMGLAAQSAKPPEDAPEFAYCPTFYPNSPDELGAAPINAAAGADLRGMDIHLAKVKTWRVRGKIAESSTKVTNLQLVPKTVSALSGLMPRLASVQPDRSFEFMNVLPGTYTLLGNGEGGPSVFPSPIVVADRHINGLPVVLSPMGELKGTVTLEGSTVPTQGNDTSPSGASGSSLVGFDRARILVGFDSFENGSNPSAPVGDDGKFSIRMILPDRYHPWVGHPPKNSWVEAIRYDNRDVKDEGIDLTGGIAGPVEVVLSPTAGDISGVVVDDDGNPVPGATAVLMPKKDTYLAHYSANTDYQGKFQFYPVRPGDYKVYAWEDVAYLAWFDPEFLKPFLSRGVELSVTENDQKALTVKVIPAKETGK
jgi:hypothetical protein